MRVAVLVYVLLYLAVELLGAHVAALDWHLITPLMVVSAVVDAMLVVSVLVAVLVAADLARHRWRPAIQGWLRQRRQPRTGWWDAHLPDGGVGGVGGAVGVRSWRPAPRALPSGSPAAPPTATHTEPTYAVSGSPARPGRRFPEDEGTLL